MKLHNFIKNCCAIVLDAQVPNSGVLAMVVVCTVVLSILAHEVTANPWAKAFGARAAQSSGQGADS